MMIDDQKRPWRSTNTLHQNETHVSPSLWQISNKTLHPRICLSICLCLASTFLACTNGEKQPQTQQMTTQLSSRAAKQPTQPATRRPTKRTNTKPTPRQQPAQKAWKQFQACTKSKSCQLAKPAIKLWYKGKQAALSFTYDDAMPCQYKDIYPIQKSFGFKATYFLYTRELLRKRATKWGQSIRNWPHWQAILDDGNELGSHSVSHPYLSKVPFAKAKRELVNSCQTIRKFIPKARCETIAYPYGDSDPRVRRFTARHYIAARQAKQGINPPSPPDMMNIKSVIPYGSTSMANLTRRVRKSIRVKGWTVWMFHGTKGQGWEPLTLKQFRSIFRMVKRYESKLWVGQFGAIARYLRERDTTRITVSKQTANQLQLLLRNKLDKRFDQPLSIDVSVPSTWKKVTVQQGKRTRSYTTTTSKQCSCTGRVTIEAIPNQGPVTIKPTF
jgi:peptidoglycan/xylan/chitin deacetylase (PgdA/CDA1 family)